jgi:hypothetical protein
MYTVRNNYCLQAYIAVCYSVVSEMEITLFPPANEQGKDLAKVSKSKSFNDFGSSQISKQVRCCFCDVPPADFCPLLCITLSPAGDL